MTNEKICTICQQTFKKSTKYCSRKCYALAPRSETTRQKMSEASKGKPKSPQMKESLSKATLGKPKPWMAGINNPNYDGYYSNDPDVKEKFLASVKERGQVWTDKHREEHSQRMLGDSNAMRGKKHTQEYIKNMSILKKKQYEDGVIKINLNKISKAEKEIAEFLESKNINYKKQFHIPNVSYIYDFYFPDKNLILEYQGDYWHANPNKYSSGHQLKIIGMGYVLVDNIWNRDKIKKENAQNKGYEIIYIWESDYKVLGLTLIEDIIQKF